MHKSFATIDKPEFINLQPTDISPLMAKCDIKILYVGENRNHSFISKDIAQNMAKTLRGAPVIGYYKEDKGDFADHGEKIIFDDEGIHFEKNTRPYGFVPPDAEVWFQKFNDQDDFGNTVEREYLMTTGYLWIKAYPEVESVVNGEGKPHSMELDEKSLEGHWAENYKNGMEFFIIDDATFLSLCILGEDVEPCFEGSSITKPEVSATFSKQEEDNEKIKTLFDMMKQLQFSLEGGNKMEEKDAVAIETPIDTSSSEFTQESDNTTSTVSETQTSQTSFEKEKEEEKKEAEKETEDYKCGENKKNDEDKYSLIEQKYSALEAKYSALEKDYQSLVEFKNSVEKEKKEELIKSFYMLSDEDKRDVRENISKYSLDEIESKLSVICVRKRVNFDSNSTKENDINTEAEKQPSTTYTLNGTETDSVPAWVAAAINTKKAKSM